MKPDVLCVPARDLRALFDQEFSVGRESVDSLLALIGRRGRLVPRDEAEADDAIKQVCTYGLVRMSGNVLAYHRQPDHSRPELARLWSIGIGGHVDAHDVRPDNILTFVDLDARAAVNLAITRELDEEIPGSAFSLPYLLGVINTDAGAGRYHVGVAYSAIRRDDHRRPKFSDELRYPAFIRPHRIERQLLEPWSEILFREFLEGDAARSRAAEEEEARAAFDEFNESRLARQAKA